MQQTFDPSIRSFDSVAEVRRAINGLRRLYRQIKSNDGAVRNLDARPAIECDKTTERRIVERTRQLLDEEHKTRTAELLERGIALAHHVHSVVDTNYSAQDDVLSRRLIEDVNRLTDLLVQTRGLVLREQNRWMVQNCPSVVVRDSCTAGGVVRSRALLQGDPFTMVARGEDFSLATYIPIVGARDRAGFVHDRIHLVLTHSLDDDGWRGHVCQIGPFRAPESFEPGIEFRSGKTQVLRTAVLDLLAAIGL